MANILIVDDSITVSKYLEAVLSAEGHKLTFAGDGVEADQKLQEVQFDLIITDVVMPRKNGYQLCRDLKSNVRFKHIPVIMLTTKNMDVDRFWGMKQGANEYLLKNCGGERLIETVNKLLAAKKNDHAENQQMFSDPVMRNLARRIGTSAVSKES